MVLVFAFLEMLLSALLGVREEQGEQPVTDYSVLKMRHRHIHQPPAVPKESSSLESQRYKPPCHGDPALLVLLYHARAELQVAFGVAPHVIEDQHSLVTFVASVHVAAGSPAELVGGAH